MTAVKMARISCDGPLHGWSNGCPDGPRSREGEGSLTAIRHEAKAMGWATDSRGTPNLRGDSGQFDTCPACVQRNLDQR